MTKYSQEEIREAVNMVIRDNGFKADEILAVLETLSFFDKKKEDDNEK